MRENGIRGVQKPGRKTNPEDRPHEESVVPDRLRRNFAVALPNRDWLGDITQLMSAQGVVYFGLLMDMCSRLIVGWAAGPRKDRRLTISALETALGWRKPPAALIHHTDRGGQYACPDYTAVLKKHGALASMSRPGTPHDNAPMESLIKTLKVEFINRHRFETREEAIAAVGEHIQMFYNCRRRHSALGYLSPAEYERQLVKPS